MGETASSQGSGTTRAVPKNQTTTTLRAVPAPKPKADAAPAPREAEPPGSGVLIVNRDWREGGMIRNSLEAAGYEVSAWCGSEDGRECLKGRRYDLVVASTNVGAGLDALFSDLRPLRPPPKVILVTDEDEGDAAARCFLPTVVVVNRPFKIVEVADIADHLMGGR